MKEMNTAANHSSLFTGSFSKPGLCLSGLWRRGGKPVTRPGRRVLLLSLHVEKDLALFVIFGGFTLNSDLLA